MFRLFRAELKKIFLKPSIFVVTGLIIFMLAASIFLYSPKTKDEEYVEYNATNLVTVNDYYNYFNTSSVYDAKTNLDYLLDRAEASLNFYKSETNVVEILKQQWLSVKSIYDGTNSSIAQSDYISLYNINERDKTDSSKILFFPAAGVCYAGRVNFVGSNGWYSSSSYFTDYADVYIMHFCADWLIPDGNTLTVRIFGYSVRGVAD